MIKVYDGIPILVENKIVKANTEDKYYISYNPSKRDYGIDTTALVVTIGDNERLVFYTLKGNHSESYEHCKNLKECIEYLMKNKELLHKISDAFEHEHLLNVN